MNYGWRFMTLYKETGIKAIPMEKKCKKSKRAVWRGLTNSCEKKRSEKQRRKGKICRGTFGGRRNVCCCVGFSPVVASGGHSPVAGCRLLTAGAWPVNRAGLRGMWASVLIPSPFGSGCHLPCDITAHLLPSALISIIKRCLPGPRKGLYRSPGSHRSKHPSNKEN